MPETKDFFIEAKRRLDILKEQQRENIMKAAQIMGDCMTENGVVQLFGIEHGRMFAMELFYRAGGLMPFHQISTLDLAIRGIVTEKEYQAKEFNDRSELVHHFWEIFQIEPQDMFIFISNTGCEGMMVEAALRAKAEGRSIIAVVSEKQADKASSHHPSGKKLTELADLVLDNGADEVDALLYLDDVHKENQIGTIGANLIAQMITAEIYHYLTEQGRDCPVLLSTNVKGADEHNLKLSNQYLGRWEF